MMDGPNDDHCALFGICTAEEAALMLGACAAMLAQMADEQKDSADLATLSEALQKIRTRVRRAIRRLEKREAEQ